MIKNISILLVLLLTSISYGQNITLIKNTNPKAKELLHGLNTTKDSLMLECDTKIKNVEIFNGEYDLITTVEANKAQISLKDLPIGEFVIETKLANKVIIIELIKYGNYNSSYSNKSLSTNQMIEGKGMMLDEELKVIKSTPKTSIAFLLTRQNSEHENRKNQRYFWTEAQINNDSGSSKTMRLVDQQSVEAMILRHKLEVKSDSGKLNKLTIWEVYDKSEFMENQVSNPEFVYSSATDIFNPTPYFMTSQNIQNL
ncbi:hypothetical protein ITJ86_09630 [Winogradskyella sp. F6397]|uniref:Uncharacterized protein n=1 Tax=Winogradskyella marina TaxID=2785530 RepID=A0ABS0EI72_9FLAO|nr:hypothetical protein [Winogradskyella marina]MBF8150157.1 hypothetical protein [Winogradskyella marina]